MIKIPTRCVLSVLFFSFSLQSISFVPIKKKNAWYTKDVSLLCMAFAAAMVHEYARQSYMGYFELAQGDCEPIPAGLSLKNYELVQAKSMLQKGPTCAWYTIMNAKALQEIVVAREQFSSNAIKQYLKTYVLPSIAQSDLSIQEMLGCEIFEPFPWQKASQLAHFLAIKNFYAACIEPTLSGQPLDYYFVAHASQKVTHSNFIRKIKRDDSLVVPILLSVPWSGDGNSRHAILLAIIKRPFKKPLMVLLNSNGLQLAQEHVGNDYILKFIHAIDNA